MELESADGHWGCLPHAPGSQSTKKEHLENSMRLYTPVIGLGRDGPKTLIERLDGCDAHGLDERLRQAESTMTDDTQAGVESRTQRDQRLCIDCN